jgi:acetoin utilization deacetylase AcuC-like enzyme
VELQRIIITRSDEKSSRAPAGALDDTGTNGGKNYSVNVPLQEGMDDDSYSLVFEPVMRKVLLTICCFTSQAA